MQKKHTPFFLGFLFIAVFCSFQSEEKANSSQPRISLIVPVSQAADMVPQTIFPEAEWILVGSSLLEHEEKIQYPNVIYVQVSPDLSLSAVWNVGIKKASADLISCASSKDPTDLKILELQVKELESHPEIDLVYTGSDFATAARSVWRKSLHEKYGFFDEEFHLMGDVEMFKRSMLLGAQLKKLSYLTTHFKGALGEKQLPHTLEVQRMNRKLATLIRQASPDPVKEETQKAYTDAYDRGRTQEDYNPHESLACYLKASELQPDRAEPLWRAAVVCRRQGNTLLGYLLSKHALSLPMPSKENVDWMVYDQALLIEFMNCALLRGRYEEGLAACNELLSNPNLLPEYKVPVEDNVQHSRRNLLPSD